MINRLVALFPVWALAGSMLAYLRPEIFHGLQAAIIPLLTVVMFGMGMTLDWEHFRDATKKPAVIGLTMALQFLFMPLFAFLVSRLLGLSDALTAGMVLVGSSAGGTASNVICYLAKGDVALSVLLTMTSTLLAVVAMPTLTYLYLNEAVPVPFTKMFTSILQIVVAPVLLGTAINSRFGNFLGRVKSLFPLLSTFAIVLIIAIIVAVNQSTIAASGPLILMAVTSHNIAGLIVGYWFPKILRYDALTCRTISIEVGMQNSGLSVALAVKYFSPMAALPGALFSIWHNLSGSLLAGIWSGQWTFKSPRGRLKTEKSRLS